MAINKIGNNIKNKKLLWLAISCFFIFLVIVLSFALFNQYNIFFGESGMLENNTAGQEDRLAPTACPDCVRRYIDGVYVLRGKENLAPAAVIVENLLEARPQSGLSRANLVYEAEAEGRITRFLAVFADGEETREIGPIRSARPYFVDWARELSALFVHVGGSPEALVKIKQENVFDMNEFYQGDYFWRDKERAAPHNVYSSGENIKKYLEKNQATEGKYLSWLFKDDSPSGDGVQGAKIKIDFNFSEFRVYWEYDKEKNDYVRYMGDRIHYDALNGQPVRAKNVIVQYVKAKIIDDVLRLKMEHIGDGETILCQDGVCQTGKWTKQSGTARTRFYKDSGEEFQFNAGPTWVEVARPEIKVEY